MPIVYQTLEKRASWSRIYRFSFSDFSEVKRGETLSSPSVVVTGSGLTAGTPTVSGEEVLVRLSSGTASTTYTLTCTVTTSGSNTLSISGYLSVVA